jgi:hypothetical protein
MRAEMALQDVTSVARARELSTLLRKKRSRLRMGCEFVFSVTLLVFDRGSG